MATDQDERQIDPRDLGFSGRIAQSRQARMMRPDGSVNVVRIGRGLWESLNLYQHLLTVSWPRFFSYVFAFYVVANVAFATLYRLAGPGAIQGGATDSAWQNAFFFSVQTIATIGYGQMTPHGLWANALVAIEALLGLMGFALVTGILFARFSRPSAAILHSRVAIVAPYRGGTGLMFRIANGRTSELIDLHVLVTYSRMEQGEGDRRVRRFHQLPLEREHVALLPTQWVIVHPIDAKSPLAGQDQAAILASDPELFITIAAVDETFFQTVHARFSYADQEIVYGARFTDPFGTTAEGVLTIDVSQLSDVERVALPGGVPA